MSSIKKVGAMLKCNLKQLLIFELIFKLLSFLIFTPLFISIFNLIMKLTGYNYLTLENIISFFLNPITLILLLVLVLLMMIYTMFDITTIIITLDASYNGQKIKVIDAMRIAIAKCRKLFHLKNILLAVMVLFLIPFLHIGVASSFITTIKIPEFILDFIVKNKTLLILFLIVVIGLVILLLKWMYSLNYFVLEDVNFKEARKRSINISKKNHLKDLLTITVIQILSSVFYFLFVALGVLVIFLFNKIFGNIIIIKSIFTTIIWFFIAISFIGYTLLATPISYAGISSLYYLHKGKKGEKIKSIKLTSNSHDLKIDKYLKRIVAAFVLVSLILGTVFTYGLYKGKYNLNIEYVRTLEVTAHRGASVNYPENTMSAFVGAKELGADFIELDVQQTKDGKIIVMHDTNLKRTTGVNKNTWEVTYDEIKDLDAGSFLDKKYKDEHIPLLRDVIEWAKDNDMKLNIELKPTGREKNFEKSVIDIVEEFDYVNNCVVTSQVYSVLENIKKENDKVETVYVMSIAYGNITTLKYADHFSVEASNVNRALVNRVHNEGKQLYAWTVNTKDNIKNMIDLKVDNIITDNITLAKDTIYESKTSNLINEYVGWIEKIF